MKTRFTTKCVMATVDTQLGIHCLSMLQTDDNTGMFASKVTKKQFEKIESVLSKRYIKLPFGIRILI